MAAAPFVSLHRRAVVLRAPQKDPPPDRLAVKETEGGLTLRRGAGFAVAVFAVMVAEQTLLNASVLTVEGTSPDAALAGVVFSVLLIARAPLQLFQAVQGSLLPHLAGLEATAGRDEFRRAIRVTVLAIAAFARRGRARAVRDRPVGRRHAVSTSTSRLARGGLALVGLGMGFHLIAGHAQPGGARARAGRRGGRRVAAQRRRCSSPSCSARSSTTSCCAPRSATSARRRCCARCSRSSTAVAARSDLSQRRVRNPVEVTPEHARASRARCGAALAASARVSSRQRRRRRARRPGR